MFLQGRRLGGACDTQHDEPCMHNMLRRAADALLLDNTTLDRDAGIMAAIAFVEDKVGKRG